MLKTITLDTKADLIKFRKETVEGRNGTVCRLLYRSGKYELTYYTEKLTQEDLILMGFRKAKKKTQQKAS